MIVLGELNTAQLPGQEWTVVPTTRIWSWGGLEELTATSPSMAIACCRPEWVEWPQVVVLIQSAPFERGFIGDLKVFQGKVWWKGWLSLEEAASDPDAVLSIVRRIFRGHKTVSATELAEVAATAA